MSPHRPHLLCRRGDGADDPTWRIDDDPRATSAGRIDILALAGLDFIKRAEVVHLLEPPGTGKSHIATALAVEAVKAGKSVYFIPLADLIAALAKAEREGTLRERIRFLCRSSLLAVLRCRAGKGPHSPDRRHRHVGPRRSGNAPQAP